MKARWIAGLVVLPLLVLPWRSPSTTADLSGHYTDHLRHAYAGQVFLARGLDLYRFSFGEAAKGVESRHFGAYWAHAPYAYPPGALLLFLPVALASERWVDDPVTHARLLVTFTTALALLAWLAVLQLLFARTEQTPLELAVRAVIAAFGFLALMRAGLEGFYDPAWVALGIAAIIALERKSFGAALGLCAAAAAIHLRAAALLPVAAVAFAGLFRERGSRALFHPAAIVAALVAVMDVAVFVAVNRYAAELRGDVLPLGSKPGPLAFCSALSIGAAAFCVWRSKPLAAATIFVVLGLALGDNRAWWHASMALIPLFLFASGAPALRRADAWGAVFLLVWAVQLQRFAWGGRVWDWGAPIATTFVKSSASSAARET